MRKSIAILCVLFAFASCKTKQAVIKGQSADEARPVKEIVEGYSKNKADFKTLYIKAGVDYRSTRKGKEQSYNASADIRIKRGEKILVSIRFLGITLAKGLITPDKVTYYEKINNTYFEGDYAALSRWLGTELNYAKVESMITGGALEDLTKGMYNASLENGMYKLQSADRSAITKQFFFEGANFLLKKQTISQAGQEPRSLQIEYPAHNEYANAVLPARIKIEAEQRDRVNIVLDYDSVTFNEDISFPFDVPEGFEQIFIEQ